MESKTLDALKAFIRHWRDVVDNPLTTCIGPDECALCDLFWREGYSVAGTWLAPDSCVGCPVHAHTGQKGCIGTPYGDFEHYASFKDADERHARELATNELSFLEGLLPSGEVA